MVFSSMFLVYAGQNIIGLTQILIFVPPKSSISNSQETSDTMNSIGKRTSVDSINIELH